MTIFHSIVVIVDTGRFTLDLVPHLGRDCLCRRDLLSNQDEQVRQGAGPVPRQMLLHGLQDNGLETPAFGLASANDLASIGNRSSSGRHGSSGSSTGRWLA